MPCSTSQREKKKPSSLYCVGRANDKNPLCVVFSGSQPGHLLCGMAVFKPVDMSVRPEKDSVKKHRLHQAVRFSKIPFESNQGPGAGMLWSVCVEADILMIWLV